MEGPGKEGPNPGKPGKRTGARSTGNRGGAILAAVVRLKGENHLLRFRRRHDGQPRTSVYSAAALDLRPRQQPLLDATSSFLPLGFQKGEIFPYFVEHLSCFDEAAPLSSRNHQVPARKGQDASVSHAPPKAGSTTPQEQPAEPWRAPDLRYREECARESRHILSHAGWLDASGNVNFYSAAGPAAARSRRRTPRKSPFHWRGGAWPAPPETASANRPAASPLF